MGLEFLCSNYSRDTITHDLWVSEEVYRNYELSIGVVLSIFLLIGIPWNSVVIIVILKNRLFVQPAIVLLLNLAVTDLLLCVLVMPFNIVSAFSGEFIFGSSDYVRCQVCQTGLIFSILLLMSVYNVTLLSLDRFLFVRVPLQYKEVITIKRVVFVLGTCWSVFTLVSLLPLLGIGSVSYTEIISACSIRYFSTGLNAAFIYLWAFVVLALVLPGVILLVTNIWMLCIVKKGLSKGFHRAVRNSVGPGGRPSSTTQLKDKYKRRQIRLLQVFGAIFCADLLTSLPTAVSLFLVAIVIVPGAVIFSRLCLLFQVVIHPILQVLLLQDIRYELAKLLKPCGRGSGATEAHSTCGRGSGGPLEEEEEEETDDTGQGGVVTGKCRILCRKLDMCAISLISYYSTSTEPASSTVQEV